MNDDDEDEDEKKGKKILWDKEIENSIKASESFVRCDTKAIENPFKKSLVKTRCGSIEKEENTPIFAGVRINKRRKIGRSVKKNHEIQIFSGKVFPYSPRSDSIWSENLKPPCLSK